MIRISNLLVPLGGIVVSAALLVISPSTVGGPPPRPDPAVVGAWDPPVDWPVTAIHAVTLPNGHVLHFSSPDMGPGAVMMTWDPVNDVFQDVPNVNVDIFCSGVCLLPNGQVYITGGNDFICVGHGQKFTHRYKPFTNEVVPDQLMAVHRWYPVNCRLGDGRVIIISGSDQNCALTDEMEYYTPGGAGTLTRVPAGDRFIPLYASMHLLSSGKVAMVGPNPETYIFDPENPSWTFVANTGAGLRDDGNTVLIPGQTDNVLIIGGTFNNGSEFHADCQKIDFSQPAPQWQPAATLNFARHHSNAVILPDQKVVVIGGGTGGPFNGAVLIPEMYDPVADTWTVLPAMTHPRMYHSTAVLLPDGRVLSAGMDSGISATTAEFYNPPYLFRGPRPVIASPPAGGADIDYGSTFTINTPDADTIQSVVLVALSSVTHAVDTTQRLVPLTFARLDSATLSVIAPSSWNIAPRGYYMLFILNGKQVPSVAAMVRITGTPVPISNFPSHPFRLTPPAKGTN